MSRTNQKRMTIMKIKKTLSVSLAALMLMSAAAVPALAAEDTKGTVPDDFPTVDYVDGMIKALEGYEGDIPMDIAANPMEEELDTAAGCPNPFVDCENLDKAAQLAGFSLSVPSAPNWVSVLDGEGMIQADYESGMYIRKAVGSSDISGDYNDYAQTVTVDGVTLKGEKDAVSLAVWSDDSYSYCIGVREALSQVDMLALVASVK
jgi:hypothetical protein